MKWKIAVATLAAAAIASAPLAGAKPANNGNGNKPVAPPGQTISAIAKAGGGAAAVLGGLIQLKPTNPGLPKALQRVTATKTPTPTPTPEPTPTPTPEPTPTATP